MVHGVAGVGLDQVWSGLGAEEGEEKGCVGGGAWRREGSEEGGGNESETNRTSWTHSPSFLLSSVSHFLPSFSSRVLFLYPSFSLWDWMKEDFAWC